MPAITWVLPNGERVHDAEVAEGGTLMDAAVFNGVPGITGDCGGCLSCATCRVRVEPAWRDALPPAGPEELTLLDAVGGDAAAGERLSCQLQASAALDGLMLHVPA